MLGYATSLLLALAAFCLAWELAQAQPQQGMPRGGVLDLNEKTFIKTIQSNPNTFVAFLSGSPAEASYEGYLMQQLEYVAAVVNQKAILNVKIASVNAGKNPGLLQQLGIQAEARPIMLFRSKVAPHEYFGQRTAESMVQFLGEAVTSPPVRIVSTKAEKKKYDDFDFAKVVAYVEPGTKMEKWYKVAAEHFLPTVPFFQVTDKKIAKSLRLKKSGAGLFVKPNEKAISFPSNVTEDRSLIRFVYSNRKQALMQLRMIEMHLTWSGVWSPNLFFAVVKPKSDVGARFFGTLKSVAKHFAGNKSLNLAWADPSSDAQQMIEQWSKSFAHEDLGTDSASFAFIDLVKNKFTWLDLKEDNVISKPKLVIQWVADVLDGKVELNDVVRVDPNQKKTEEEDFDIPDDSSEPADGEGSEHTEL